MIKKIDYSNKVYLKGCKTERQREVLNEFLASNQCPIETAEKLRLNLATVYKLLRRIKDNVHTEAAIETSNGPKILVFDIETAPILGAVWGLWKNNVGLNQIKQDWYIISFAAHWLGTPDDEIIYRDLRDAEDRTDDYHLLEDLWDLLNEADIVLTQNGKKFDSKKANARFVLQGFKPVSSYRHYDTLIMDKKRFGFTSNRLEYKTHKLCKKYKKLTGERKYSGFDLWKATCWDNNLEAWEEMEVYNTFDVLSLKELFYKVAPWDNALNLSVYYDDHNHHCVCGSTSHSHNGYYYTNAGKYDRYSCDNCGAETRGRTNLLSKEKRKSMLMPTVK